MNKRKISLFLSGMLSISAFCPVFGYESDIGTHWAKESFERLEGMGILQGYEDGTYRPDGLITRAEFFTVVNRVSNASRNAGSSFSDVAVDAWYKKAVDFAATAKYASGYGDGTFRPEEYITRAESAAVICKAFGGDIEKSSEFSDSESIESWAKEYIDILVSGGFLSGYEDGSFRASDYITRGETAAIFDRFIGEIYKRSENVTDGAFEKNLIISTTDLVFKNTEFKGDIYIGAGVSGGEVRFIDCTLGGTVHMAGRNGATVVFENTDCEKVCVNSTDVTSVISTGSSVIENVVTRSECSVWEMNTDNGINNLTVFAKTDLSGTFSEVIVADGKGITLSDGKIDKLTVTAQTRPNLEINGDVDESDIKGSCIINGESISSGDTIDNISTGSSSDIKYSYTLSRYNNDDFESKPITGGSRTEIQLDKKYVLDMLSVSNGVLVPEFAPEITEYSLVVPNSAGSISIIPEIDELSECRVAGKVISGGYEAKNFANTSEVVEIDVYNGLIKRNTYTVTVTGYGTDNTTVSDISLDLPHELKKSSDGLTYTFTLTGDIDYSGGTIPAEVSIVTMNPNSVVEIDGVRTRNVSVDLYNEKKQSLTVNVTSEDGTATKAYTVEVTRPHISAIDDPNPDVVDRLIANPESMTAEDIKLAKLYGVADDKMSKYISYIKTTAYHADGKDTAGKQAVIQNAIDVVNKWDGKSFRIEIEDYNSWAPNIKAYADDESRKITTGLSKVTLGAKGEFDDVPEGNYNIEILWGDRQNNTKNVISVNETAVYSGATAKSWLSDVWNSGTITTTTLKPTTMQGYLKDSGNTVLIETSGSTAIMDYIEFGIVF